MNTDDLVVYSVKVWINKDYTFRVRVFSNEDAEEVLTYYYYDKLFDKQPDITKYTITRISVFKESEQLAIALKGFEYADRFQS